LGCVGDGVSIPLAGVVDVGGCVVVAVLLLLVDGGFVGDAVDVDDAFFVDDDWPGGGSLAASTQYELPT